MKKTVKLLDNAEKELQKAKEKGHVPESDSKLVHELQVHQIELEMQNEELRDSQKEYRELSEKYFNLYNFAPVGYFTLNKNGIILDVNLTGELLLGMEKPNIINKPFILFIKPKWRNLFYNKIKSIIEIRFKHDFELELIKKDKSTFWALIGLNFTEDENYYRITITDITEHKKAEDTIKEKEENFNTLFGSMNEAFMMGELILDEKGNPYDLRYLSVNRTAASSYGMEPEQMDNKRFSELFPNMEPPYIKEIGEVVLTGKPVKDMEAFSPITNYWLEVDIYPQKKCFFSIFARNITERKKAEEALKEAYDNLEMKVKERTKELEEAYDSLKESEEKFREVFNKADDMVTLVELKENGMPGKFIEVNEVASSRLGYSRDEFLNMTPNDIIAPEKLSIMPNIAQEMKRNRKARFEIIHVTKDGRKIPVEVNNHIFKLRGKDVILAISRDITDRKKAEKQLKETIEELKRSNKELQQFAYVSSHDLQEPLRTIASFTQLLERRYKGKFDSDADEFMDYIVDAAVRMKEQIEGLLEYSRVATEGEGFQLVNMNDILNQTLKNLDFSIKEFNAEITVEELPNVMGDAGQLQRVFQNLISNAIKFRKQGKSLKIHISAYKSEDEKEYVFSVQDNGIGIEEQYMERIFTIFQQLHTMDEYKGTGIGLSIVKRVIEIHGGHIWVDSKLGEGSTFYFTIPV